MKNLNYFPFERNHYYYGKLLTVEDFELEQRYMNNKRRLLNRYFHGMGVVFGMNTVLVDDATISVQPGYALDAAGREILLTEGVSKKLSDISGFESFQENEKSYAYLCVEYDEEEKEIVYNATKEDPMSEGNEYNKCRESYRFFLSCNEPKGIGRISDRRLYENKVVVYAGNDIRISHIMPRFVQAGEEFDFVVEIENMGQQKSFAFAYDLECNYLKNQNSARLKINFDEKREKKAYKYRQVYRLRAQDAIDIEAAVKVLNDEMKLVLMDTVLNEEMQGKAGTYITSSLLSKATDSFYETEMDVLNNELCMQTIYLARIHLLKEGKAYVIQHMEPMPFEQYVWSSRLSELHQQTLGQEVLALKKKMDKISEQAAEEKNDFQKKDKNIAYGTYELEIAHSKQKGKVFCSEEIVHGLGIGEVNIMLAVSTNEKEAVWGSTKVFQETETKFELAAKVYKEKGTFIIGARTLEASRGDTLHLYWRAEKNPIEAEQDDEKQAIVIAPNFINVKVRETKYIEADCQNMNDKRLKWSVEKYGGIIDKHGMYTAPDKTGIYEVTASSAVYANVSASVYVVVREQDSDFEKDVVN